MRRTAALCALALLLTIAKPDAAAAVSLSAGGATVAFPIGTPLPGMGDPKVKHRHGEPWMMLLLGTIDVEEAGEKDGEALVAALKGVELWSVVHPATNEAFWFATMPFPRDLATRLWAAECRPPEPGHFVCRPVTVEGAPGREYLFRAKDPTRPNVRSYLVQRVFLRGDRLFLLAYDGGEDIALPEAARPSSPQQEVFLNSLRFDGP